MRIVRDTRVTPPIVSAPGAPPRWPLGVRGAGRGVWRRRGIRVALLALVVALLAASALVWRLSSVVTSYAGAHFNHNENAVWLEHSWAGGAHSDAEYDALAARLSHERIGYVFAHVGPLDSDGRIPVDRAPNAATLVGALHQRLPGMRVLAWIGQVEAVAGYAANQSVDLGDSVARRQIAQTAARFVTNVGFDGVHFDIEPIINNNPRFIDLLVETRALLPHGALLSTVGQKWAPSARAAEALRSMGRGDAWWSSYYYADVAAHVDQIVAMLYNTAMPTAAVYQLAVKEEATHILRAVRSARQPPATLFGLPTYSGDDFWFHAGAENMRSGLQGVIAGLNSDTDVTPFTGVAIYRYASTTDADWNAYDALWLGSGGAG